MDRSGGTGAMSHQLGWAVGAAQELSQDGKNCGTTVKGRVPPAFTHVLHLPSYTPLTLVLSLLPAPDQNHIHYPQGQLPQKLYNFVYFVKIVLRPPKVPPKVPPP